jgi:integrase
MAYRPVETINNSAWQRAREACGLSGLHVHDLRHTVGMRLREAGVAESTVADILWHTTRSMTHHYSVAQIAERQYALERMKSDEGRWNRTLAMIRLEEKGKSGRESPKGPPPQEKRARHRNV